MQGLFLRRRYPEPKPKNCAITVTSGGQPNYVYLTVNGETISSAGTYEVPIGVTIVCNLQAGFAGGRKTIVVNGETKYSGMGRGWYAYEYIVTKDATIDLLYNTNSASATITITEG